MKKFSFFILFLILFKKLCFSFFDWEVLKTEKITLFYKNKYENRAIKLLSAIEYLSIIPEQILDNKVYLLPIILEDYGGYSNGFADPIYFNIHIMNNETGDADWLSLVGIHEYTHILHLTKADGIPDFLRNIAGNIFCPQIFSPNWMFEGIAVYNESQIDKYGGRLNDGGFDAYIATSVIENKFPSILKATYIPLEAPFGNAPYIFGSKFLTFLSQKYGEEKLKNFYKSYGSSLLSYFSPIFPWLGIDRTFMEVYGKSTEDLWMLWEIYETEKNLNYEQPGERITNFNSYVSYPVIYNDALYFTNIVLNKNGVFSIQTRQDVIRKNLKTDEIELLFSTTSNINHPFRFLNDKMYYSVKELKSGFENRSNFSYGFVSSITERDIKTGEEKEILSDEIRTFDFLDEKLIYAKDKKYNFGSELYEYDLMTKKHKILMETENYIFLIVSYNKNLYCVAKKYGENKGIYKIDLNNKNLETIVDTPYIEDNFWIADNKIFFQSNHEKKYFLYCYDIKSKKVFRLTDNGFAGSPVYDKQRNNLYFIGLHSDGFDIYRLPTPEFKKFNFKKEKVKKISIPDIDKEKFKKGNYLDNMLTLFPKIRIPFVYIDSNKHFNAGFFINGMDAIGDFNYTLLFLYDVKNSITYQDLTLNSYMLSPLTMSFLYSNYNNKRTNMIGLGFEHILHISYKPGISYVSTTIENCLYENFTKLRMVPGINTTFSYPNLNLGLSVKIIFENEELIFTQNSKEGYYGRFAFAYFLPETKITFVVDGFYGLNKNIDNEIKIRGYQEKIIGEKGILFTNEISRNFLKIRMGLWNPANIYFEDLFAILFFDYAMNEINNYYSYGIKLHTEIKFAFVVNLDFGIFFSLNKYNEKSYGILLKTPVEIFGERLEKQKFGNKEKWVHNENIFN